MIIGSVIVVAVIVWLLMSNVLGSTTPYLEVSQIRDAGPSPRLVRAVGNATQIKWDAQESVLRFQISDEGASLPVVFAGVRPDLLVEGSRAVAEGRYTSSGLFEASKLLLQCPSKYEEG